jgi:glycerate 2-kinase
MNPFVQKLVDFIVDQVNPYKILKRKVKINEDFLIVNNQQIKLSGDIYVISVGKAACSMGRAVEDLLGEKIKEGIAVTKYGYAQELKKLNIVEAGHPYPDENSIEAGKLGLELVKRAKSNDTIIFLISGGASSLFEVPEEGISPEDLRKAYTLLVNSGMNISEINTIRKHISKIKGGKILKYTRAKIISLIISDVVGNDLSTIASGLTYKDPTTFKDAYELLTAKDLWKKLPDSVKKVILRGLEDNSLETLKEIPENVHNFLIADNDSLLLELKKFVESFGVRAEIITSYVTGEAREFGKFVSSIVKEIKTKNRPFSPPVALIFGGETYVTVTSRTGKGGPNQEIILSMINELKDFENVLALALDTDGTDGPTDAAGAYFDENILRSARNKDIRQYLIKNSAYDILKDINALIFTGPTYSNLNSICVVILM